MRKRCVVVIMGVSGSGKSSVAQALGAWLEARHEPAQVGDADAFHTADNIAKMRGGTPLDDADRQGWLAAIGAFLGAWATRQDDGCVLFFACSALRRRYRDTLRDALPPDTPRAFVYLSVPEAWLAQRLRQRDACGQHFMRAPMLASQLATLEPPDPRCETDAIEVLAVDAAGAPKGIAEVTCDVVRCLPAWADGRAPKALRERREQASRGAADREPNKR